MWKRLLFSLLLVTVLVVGCEPQQPSEVITDAYTAQIRPDRWTVQLNPRFFLPDVKSVSVAFGGTLYGVYLTKDKVILPPSPKPKQLVLTGYNKHGEPVMKTIFMLPR
jgi:hypothetical protein